MFFRKKRFPIYLLTLIPLQCWGGEATLSPFPASAYDSLFPYFLESCQLTEARPKGQKAWSGTGHAFFYLKGACRDTSQALPRIKPCEAGTDLKDPDSGVGISANIPFKNVNWVAIEGKSLFLYGGLKPTDSVDESNREKLIERVLRSGAFDGVEFYPIQDRLHPQQSRESDTAYLIRQSVASDFAAAWGRNVKCERIPLNPAQLLEAIHFLNQENAKYEGNHQPNRWQMFGNNCAHIVHNVTAALGYQNSRKIHRPLPLSMLTFPLPSNEWLSTVEAANEAPIENPRKLFASKRMREMILKFGKLPSEHGALAVLYPMHAHENQLFEPTTDHIYALDYPLPSFRHLWHGLPFRWARQEKMSRIWQTPRYTDLEANFKFYESRYLVAQSNLRKLKSATQGEQEFYTIYEQVLENALEDVREKMRALLSLR